nr:hypothetical protein [Glycomyces tenuis]
MKRLKPRSSVRHRPTPVKFGSRGAGCAFSAWALRPAALTCRISTSCPAVVFITHDIDESVYLGQRALVPSLPPAAARAAIAVDH